MVQIDDNTLPMGLCLTDPSWHQGVIGILASRLKERFHRPVIAFASADDAQLKGSARSIANVHIRDCLSDIATAHPDLIIKFGGHAMAAGLSIRKTDFERFKHAFESYLAERLPASMLDCHIDSDGSLSSEHLCLPFAKVLREAGPWGQQFPEPIFDDWFEVLHFQTIKQVHLKLSIRLADNSHAPVLSALLFNADKTDYEPILNQTIHLAYRLDVNDFRGNQSVQLMIEHVIKQGT